MRYLVLALMLTGCGQEYAATSDDAHANEANGRGIPTVEPENRPDGAADAPTNANAAESKVDQATPTPTPTPAAEEPESAETATETPETIDAYLAAPVVIQQLLPCSTSRGGGYQYFDYYRTTDDGNCYRVLFGRDGRRQPEKLATETDAPDCVPSNYGRPFFSLDNSMYLMCTADGYIKNEMFGLVVSPTPGAYECLHAPVVTLDSLVECLEAAINAIDYTPEM